MVPTRISDHGLFQYMLGLPSIQVSQPCWKLNTQLLHGTMFRKINFILESVGGLKRDVYPFRGNSGRKAK